MTFYYRPYRRIKVPMLRAVFPKLIAEELCSVQEMDIRKHIFCPYIPLGIHPYPEKKWFNDEDFLI